MNSSLMIQEVERLCRDYGVEAAPTLFTSILDHYELLMKWNAKISLTAIAEPEQVARHLYFEPLYSARFIAPDISTAADAGSGGGFPGIPIALLKPELNISLIEADRRKAAFLNEARHTLNLRDLRVINSRFEDCSDQFDLVCARALERFEDQFPRLIGFAARSRQILLYLSLSAARKMLDFASTMAWKGEITALPESRERSILSLTRFT